MPSFFIFVLLAGSSYGLGHLNRCLILGERAKKMGINVSYFAIGADAEKFAQGVSGLDVLFSLHEVEVALKSFSQKQATIIFDISHPDILNEGDQVDLLFQNIGMYGHRVVAIDNLGDKSFRRMFPKISFDLIVVPYVGNMNELIVKNTLIGSNFAILGNQYEEVDRRQVRYQGSNLLITTGGSDACRSTEIILHAVARLEARLSIRVIIGPFFDRRYLAELQYVRYSLYHDVEFVVGRSSLFDDMYWADVCLAASGVVKYELAATGTPSILFSINEQHDKVNKDFVAASGQMDLGMLNNIDDIVVALKHLLNSYSTRRNMALRGQHLVDARGVSRILDALTTLQ